MFSLLFHRNDWYRPIIHCPELKHIVIRGQDFLKDCFFSYIPYPTALRILSQKPRATLLKINTGQLVGLKPRSYLVTPQINSSQKDYLFKLREIIN